MFPFAGTLNRGQVTPTIDMIFFFDDFLLITRGAAFVFSLTKLFGKN